MLFEKAEASDFLKGSNDRNWTATFDWLIKDANMAKVIDGNYDNRSHQGQPKKNKFMNFDQREDNDDLYTRLELQASGLSDAEIDERMKIIKRQEGD